jgi:hypothetical protein
MLKDKIIKKNNHTKGSKIMRVKKKEGKQKFSIAELK